MRQQGSTLTLAGNGEERWKLTRPLSQHAALIEAACFGATLQEAARNKLEADMLDAVESAVSPHVLARRR
mgnify:FL=1